MFINSIFLPKNLSDQTMPEGVVNTIGNFSHLFTSVYKIVKDEQQSSNPEQLIQQIEKTSENIQDELLKISLLSDNKLSNDNSNISSIVSLFMSQIRPGEYAQDLADSNKVKVTEKTPKYFSLSKNDFVKEIKSIIDSLKNGEVSQSENVELSLIANGQVIQINPSLTSVSEFENLITEQLQTNSEFKVLVKSGAQKLTLDVEPIKADVIKSEVTKTISPVEIISPGIDENIVPDKTGELKVKTESAIYVQDRNTKLQDALQPLLEGLQHESVKPDNAINSLSKNISETPNSVFKDQIIEVATNTNKANEVTSTKENIVNSKNQTEKNKPVFENIKNKTLASELNKPDQRVDVKSDLKEFKVAKPETEKIQSPDLKTQLLDQSDKKISVKSNQKINSISLNKNTLEEKVELSNLIEDTDVKEIKINVPKILKNSVDNPVQKVSQAKFEPVDVKQNINKDLPEIKIGTKTVNKNDVSSKLSEPNKVQNNSRIPNQHELFTDSEPVETDFVKSQNLESQKNITNSKLIDKEPFVNKEFAKPIIKQGEVVESNTESNKTIAATTKSIELKQIVQNENEVDTDNSSSSGLNEKVKLTVDNQNKTVSDNKTELKPVTSNVKEPVKIVTVNIDEVAELKSSDNTLKNVNKNLEKITLNDSSEMAVNEDHYQLNEHENNDIKKTEVEKPILNKNAGEVKEIKNTKIDFKERRVYSQIPKLEVIAEETKPGKVLSPDLNAELNKNDITRVIEEPVKSAPNNTNEASSKNEKQVWVKVSVEKTENENPVELRKTSQQNKITIDVNDNAKKDFTSDDYSENDFKEKPKQKLQVVTSETVQNNEQKSVVQNQTTNQMETTANIKPEIKTEHNTFKLDLQNQETRFTSRQAEMVEKVKVISSGEMVREVYKVLENGDKQSVVLRLVPKELGAIKVVLDTIDNVLTAKVEVENETVGSIIKNNVEQLKQNLAQSGVHVNSINISYNNSEQQKQHGFNNQKRKNPAYLQSIDVEEVDETIVTKKMGYNTYEYLA